MAMTTSKRRKKTMLKASILISTKHCIRRMMIMNDELFSFIYYGMKQMLAIVKREREFYID